MAWSGPKSTIEDIYFSFNKTGSNDAIRIQNTCQGNISPYFGCFVASPVIDSFCNKTSLLTHDFFSKHDASRPWICYLIPGDGNDRAFS